VCCWKFAPYRLEAGVPSIHAQPQGPMDAVRDAPIHACRPFTRRAAVETRSVADGSKLVTAVCTLKKSQFRPILSQALDIQSPACVCMPVCAEYAQSPLLPYHDAVTKLSNGTNQHLDAHRRVRQQLHSGAEAKAKAPCSISVRLNSGIHSDARVVSLHSVRVVPHSPVSGGPGANVGTVQAIFTARGAVYARGHRRCPLHGERCGGRAQGARAAAAAG
jgi:hypothetical protein